MPSGDSSGSSSSEAESTHDSQAPVDPRVQQLDNIQSTEAPPIGAGIKAFHAVGYFQYLCCFCGS